MIVAPFAIATLVKVIVDYFVICFLFFFAMYEVQQNLYKETMVQCP